MVIGAGGLSCGPVSSNLQVTSYHPFPDPQGVFPIMNAIEEISAAIATVADAAGPSIVTIGRNARGSGVVLADGQVLTNAHNLRGGEVTVTFADGRSTRGTVTGVDPDGDLAVVSVDTAGARAIDWGAGDGLAVGAPVFGIAATFGGGVRVTFGLV